MQYRSQNERFQLALCLVAHIAGCNPSSPATDDVGLIDAGADAPVDVPVDVDSLPQDAAVDSRFFDAADQDAGPTLPLVLSDSGLFEEGVNGPYAAGVRAYDVRFPLWTDGAEKVRHILLPPGTAIDTRDPNGWFFPVGTRLFKEFRVDGVPVETRLTWKVANEYWVYVSYRYRADGSDADAVPDGEPDARSTTHDIPSQAQCRNCHSGVPDFVLGVSAVQLDQPTWDLFTEDGILDVETTRGQVPGTPIEQAALGYLHGNCGHCHGEHHFAGSTLPLRLWLPVGTAAADDAPAWQTTSGIPASHDIEGTQTLVVPGNPEQSQLFVRMGDRSVLQMPPLGTEQADPQGMQAVRSWIER